MRMRTTTTKGRPWNFAREERQSDNQLLRKRTRLCSTSNRTSLRWIQEQTTGIRVRVIFDSGSQKSFIKGSVRDQLKLPTITKEPSLI